MGGGVFGTERNGQNVNLILKLESNFLLEFAVFPLAEYGVALSDVGAFSKGHPIRKGPVEIVVFVVELNPESVFLAVEELAFVFLPMKL